MLTPNAKYAKKFPRKQKSSHTYIHQVVDIEANNGARKVTEYRCYSVLCSCGRRVPAATDQVPTSAFGPRISGLVCTLSGAYNLSRRQVTVMLKDLYAIDMSLGSVSNIEGRMISLTAMCMGTRAPSQL